MSEKEFEWLATELQMSLGTIAAEAPPPPPGIDPCTLFVLQRLKLKMYQERGHSLPHIHIDYGKQHHVASYSIDPPKCLEGKLDKHDERTIIGWLGRNKSVLLALWNDLQRGEAGRELFAELGN